MAPGNDFLTAVKPAFGFLISERGYALVHEVVSASFDNGSLIYESPRLHITVVRDRGQISAVVRARGDHRDYDQDILRLLLANAVQYANPEDHSRFSAAGEAAFLQKHLSDIEVLFAPTRLEDTCRIGNALMSQRADVLFGKRPKF